MMNAYDLPTSLEIGGVGFPIRYGWRAVIDILSAFSDPALDDWGKQEVMLKILYPDWEQIPPEHIPEALQKACDFIDCGQKDDGKPRPRTYDWEQDALIIIPEINKVANTEVRLTPDLHWWTFFSYFMGIGDGTFASVVAIRQKKAKHKKLEKWEETFYRENRALVDLKTHDSEEVKAEKENIMKWL